MRITVSTDGKLVNPNELLVSPIDQLHNPLGYKDSRCEGSTARQKRRVHCRVCKKYRTPANQYKICVACLPCWKVRVDKRSATRTWKRANYGDLAERFGSECGICGRLPKRKRHIIDYDRKTRQPEGLLCYHCFNGLRYFKFKFPRINNAVEYLRVKYEAREERGDSYGYFE